MADIFISYSREDQATARRFAQALEAEGFSVWWDQTLHSGDPYDRMTELALKDAKAAVVLWSPRSVESRWVRAEATMADRRGTLVPVMIEACERPLMFELTQAAELMHWKADRNDPAWRAFVDDVRRFVAGVRPAPGESAIHPAVRQRRSQLRWSAIAVAALLAAAAAWMFWPWESRLATRVADDVAGMRKGPVSIAVLPFVDMTGEGRDTPLAEGLSEEISNWLAQIPELKVVARTSSFRFRGANQDMRKVGRELDATHLLEGSVRRGGDTVRVTVQLVAAADGYHVWSRTYDMPDGNALKIEDAVSRSVAESLNTRLTEETERRWKARQTQDRESYSVYLEGRYQLGLNLAEPNLRAIELFRQAIAADPSFAPAYVSLAEALLGSRVLNRRKLSEIAPQVTTLLDQADALMPDMPESIAARGWLAIDQLRTEEALTLMQRAIALNPNLAGAQYRLASILARLAQPRKAAEQFAVAAQLDPLDYSIQMRRCRSLADLADYAAAEQACARARELSKDSHWGLMSTYSLNLARGDFAAAMKWIDQAIAIAPQALNLVRDRIWLLNEMGQFEEAARSVASLPADALPMRQFQAAFVAIARGDSRAGAQALAAIQPYKSGLSMIEWLDLVYLQLISGDPQAANNTLREARQAPDWDQAVLWLPDSVRLTYSSALIVAAAELAAGSRQAGIAALDGMDAMLDRMEQDGAACNGLYALRAQSQALRGNADRAMAYLRTAQAKGWHQARSARLEPYLQSLRDRADFNQLMADADRDLQANTSAWSAARN